MATRQEVILGSATRLRRRAVTEQRWANASLYVGVAILGLVGLVAIFAPLIAPHSPNAQDLAGAFQPPSGDHIMGTDNLGRDIFSRVVYAARVDLQIGFITTYVPLVYGVILGAVAGYFGGWVDQVLMRLVDLLLVLPGTALVMIAQKGLGSSLPVIVLILAFLFWRSIARIVRGLFLSLKSQEFVEAARASGATSARIIVSEMLPSAVGPICVHLALASGAAILSESALSFLGFGIQPPAVSWGNMLSQSRGAVGTDLAYLVYPPGLAILLTVLAVNFVGTGLRDALDPQTRV